MEHLRLLVAVAVLMTAVLVLLMVPELAEPDFPDVLELPGWDAF